MEEKNIPTREIVMEKLNSIPDTIIKAETSLIDLQEEYNSKKEEADKTRAKIYSEVESEYDTTEKDGVPVTKPRYSNETKRQAEVENRLNTDYKNLMDDIKSTGKKIKEDIVMLEFYKRKFRALEVTGLMITGR